MNLSFFLSLFLSLYLSFFLWWPLASHTLHILKIHPNDLEIRTSAINGQYVRGPNSFFKYFYFLFGPGLFYPPRVIAKGILILLIISIFFHYKCSCYKHYFPLPINHSSPEMALFTLYVFYIFQSLPFLSFFAILSTLIENLATDLLHPWFKFHTNKS